MIEKVRDKAIEAGLRPKPGVAFDQFSIVESDYYYKDICVAKYILISTTGEFLQKISVTDNALKSFETEYIEPRYFQTEGDLRWNIYIVFVLNDDEFAKIPESARSTIEQGNRYARKIVVSLSSFLETIPVAKIKMDSGRTEMPDPKNDWVTVLEFQGLEFCLNSFSNYCVDTFIKLSDYCPKARQASDSFIATDSQELRSYRPSLSRMDMGSSFRDHCFSPSQELEFGSVNLFEGANGSGKTSIFEGIEASFTGLIQRHEMATNIQKNGLDETDKWDGKICLTNGECFDSIPQERTRKERESAYYQNKEKRIAKLNQLFHQYNYFSSEATFQFSFTDGQPQYANEFSRIIFGEDLITREKNWQRYKEEFEIRRKQATQEIKQLTEDIGLAEQESVFETDDIAASVTSLKRLLTSAFYPIQQLNEINSDLDQWLRDTSSNLINLDALTAPLESMETEGITSLGIVDEKLIEHQKKVEEGRNETYNCMEALKILREKYSRQEERVNFRKNTISEAISSLSKIESAQSKLFEVLFIITNMDAGKERLVLENHINSLNKQINNIRYIKKEMMSIELSRSFHMSDYEMSELDAIKSGAIKQKEILTVQIEQNSKQIASIETHGKVLDSIISQIKVFGQRYLHEMPQATSCPLCSAEYGSYDLLKEKIIGEKSLNRDNLKELIAYKQELNEQMEQLLHQIAEVENDQLIVNKLSQLVDFASAEGIMSSDIKPYKRSLEGINKVLYAVMENEKSVCDEYERCNTRIKQLEAHGILIDTIKKAELYFQQDEILSQYNLNAGDSIEDTLRQEKEKSLSNKVELERQLAREEELLIGLNQKIKDSLIHIDDLKRTNEQASMLIKRYETWTTVFNRMQEAGIHISKDYSSAIWRSYLKKSVEEIAKIREKTEKYKQREQKQLLLKSQKMRKQNLQKIEKRCNCALSIIGDLKPLSDYSNAYLQENIKQIEALFFKLHTPNEFVKLGLNDDKIVAYRRSSMVPVHSFQMSAGQRTALALAVFFQLHMSMTTAPNFVLLDEPVANVDDLNLLGLLDFLKQLSISSNTQIFMTTANPNVAKLFMRKFSFEGDNLHYFKLRRLKPEQTKIEVIRLGLENRKEVS